MKRDFKEKMQTFGKAMLVPISLVAIGGLLLGLGGAFTNETTVSALGISWDWYSQTFIIDIFSVLKALGESIFKNLSILYAIGVAFSLAKGEKGWAAFSAAVAFLAMQSTISTLLINSGLSADSTSVEALIDSGMSSLDASKQAALFTTELGFFTYRTGVFGGIAVGLITSLIHNRFYKIKLPNVLAFFAGTRSVPIISLLAGGLLGVFFYNTWPIFGMIFANFSQLVAQAGLFGTFLYRTVLEMLVPFGIHPLLSLPMRWTELGGSMVVDGELVVGNAAIQLAQLASPDDDKLIVDAYMGGAGIIDYAIFPGIAFAMYKTSRPENKKKVAGLLIPTVISTIVFGITEPILFTFLFAAPWLYFLVYAPLAGLGEVLAEATNVSVYQGNLKDLVPFLLRPEKLNLWPYLYLLPLFFFAAYFIFRFLITRFNILTPGRTEDSDSISLVSKEEYNRMKDESSKDKITEDDASETIENSLAKNIVDALGGKDNIVEVDNCISRLRVIVKDENLVADDDVFTKSLEAMGVIRMGKGVQIVYGPHVVEVAIDVKDYLGGY